MPSPLNLLILTSQANEAEDLVTSLRNGGVQARAMYTQHPHRLAALTATHSCDLILCCVYDPKIDLQATMAHYRALDRDVPLVLIADGQTPPDVLIEAMRSGARDLIEHNDSSHLQLVIARELGDLQQRRALAQVREQLERCERHARDLVEASAEAWASIQQGIHIHANQAYCTLFGFSLPEDLDGYPILDLVAPEHQAEARAFLRGYETGSPEGPPTLDLACLRADGGPFDAELAATRSEVDGESCLRVQVRVKAPSGGEAGTADIDADTELPSRAALMRELSARLADGTGGPLALILLRITGMEHITQGAGLSAAFERAARVGVLLREAMPEGSFLARVGDDAFALAVQPADLRQAGAIADVLGKRGRQPADAAAGGEIATGCITGLTLAGPDDRSASALLDRAFRDSVAGAVRHAPQASHRQSAPQRAPTPPLNESGVAAPDPLVMAALVDEALSGTGTAELRLVYQPIASLMGDSQENYSVLVRLVDADQCLHEAKDFIGAASAAGRMGEIDRWVIDAAIAELARQRANGHKLSFFLNIAEETVQDEELIVWICNRLRDLNARGSWLTFQFPEEDVRRNLPAVTKLADGLKKIKCRIALTRCGQSDNPDTLMESLPLDFLLFSHDFARGLAEDKAKQQQLTAFARLAREFNVKSIVTGVEDARALTVLWTAGIDYVQGNFLQRPSPSIEIQG